ncbi:hypothetical protein NBH00_19885 [Paraconexibacter antarcticus]|uniref:Uncharacterized protein n=1 Tax=Paraconexibacter antarcticus TaxID=2949664 RepID=A0ABY5DNI9_9ACTN|nr:hypothetical protein [Paraconexibacter antarcticus]UTI63591.1 hypothetical protein NBH00_19885 [Paraconexibacter antarcticus]
MTALAHLPLGFQMSVPMLGLSFFVGLILFFFLLGRLSPGDGSDLVDWDPGRRADAKRILEHEDVDQMLETANRRRRAQGLPELKPDEVLQGLRRDRG